MTCGEIGEVLELYALGVLGEDERNDVGEHLSAGCPVCNRNFRRAIALNTALLTTAPDAQPSAALRGRVLAAVRPVSAPSSSWRWAWGALAASLAAAVLWLVVDIQKTNTQLAQLRRERDESVRESERLNAAMAFLRDPQTRPASAKPGETQPRATYFISPRGVLLIASNLAPLPPDRTYQMWVIPKGQAPRPAGLFRPDGSGGAVHFEPAAVDVASAAALAVTVEPETGSAAPTTTPMLVTPVAGA